MASLSANDLLHFITWTLYVLIFAITAVKFARHHRRVDFDTSLLFGAATLIIIITIWSSALPVGTQRSTGLVAAALLMSLPYALVRLVDDFAGVPSVTMRFVEAGLALAIVGIFALPQPFPSWFVATIILYFVGLEIFGALAFIRAAQQSRGFTRRRMEAVALGSLFLGLDLFVIGIEAALPNLGPIGQLLLQVCAFASGVCYFAGFVPPSWLRRAWQAPELRTAIQQSAFSLRLIDQAAALDELAQTAADALGASEAVIWRWDPTSQLLQPLTAELARIIPVADEVPLRVFRTQRAALIETSPHAASSSKNSDDHAAILAAPITLLKRYFGVLIVTSNHAPIFADDDLELVQILADQAAVVLENRELVEETARERARAEALAILEEDRRRLNAELESRVVERTAELQQALEEIESFSYSVSHDLRAPLRTIDGFSQALVEDCFDAIGPGGQDSLRRIRAASQRKSEIIDGLLRQSRVTRSDFRLQPVSLTELARIGVNDLQQLDPTRKIEVTIQSGVVATADLPHIRVVFENLLGNAWKFTTKRPVARIDFGVIDDGDEPVFVVRDNGAGFNMSYVNKMFEPFQRLHRRDEFDGTGIGLATVQRIIHRHGGKIWAEAEVDRGAALFFTLGSHSLNDVGGESSGDLIARTA